MPSRCLLDRRRLRPADSTESGTKPKFEILTDYQSADILHESFLSKNQIQVAGIESVQTLGNTYTYDAIRTQTTTVTRKGRGETRHVRTGPLPGDS